MRYENGPAFFIVERAAKQKLSHAHRCPENPGQQNDRFSFLYHDVLLDVLARPSTLILYLHQNSISSPSA
jgi:hypothetical protein